MAKQDLLTVLDQAIAALRAARKAYVSSASNKNGASAKVLTAASKQSSKPAKRGMSEEGRQRVAEAQRKRWAAKKGAAKKAARLAVK